MRRVLAHLADVSWWESALWTSLLGTLFFLVYGGSNWITSLRSDVGTLYFSWERTIPFVPILIIPYMSIDLFFAASPFLCTNGGELHMLAKRAIFAMLISAVCFLVFPLQFAFDRPSVSCSLGKIFTVLTLFDRPYNLLPSLHISLLAIIWVVYRSHTRGVLRAVFAWWFSLIALSTVLTYQHHVLDVIAGFIVAVLDFHLFPEQRDGTSHNEGAAITRPRPSSAKLHPRLLRVGARYTLLTLAFLYAARMARPWTLLFLWPAITFAIMAAVYFGAGAIVFRKSDGRLPKTTWLLLAPYLWGARLSLAYYRRSRPAYAEISPGILIGRKMSEAESNALTRLGVRAVLDLTAEYSESLPFLRLPYWNVPILDLTVPTQEQLDEAIAFIRQHSSRGPVYIHCALGLSRCACIAAAYLLAEGLAQTVPEAIERIRCARPEIVLDSDLTEELTCFRLNPEVKTAAARLSGVRIARSPARPFLTWGTSLTGRGSKTSQPQAVGGKAAPAPEAGSLNVGPWDLTPGIWP